MGLLRWLKNIVVGHSATATKDAVVPTHYTAAQQSTNRYKRITIPLYDGVGDPPPGHWKRCANSTVHRFKAELTCPFGHGMILKGHAVASNGFVSPSVVCHNAECHFHDFVTLAEWNYHAVG